MREIKFRAWHIKLNKIIYDRNATSTPIFTSNYLYRKDEVILMQYTGLKDKKGKEIYEGDIIQVDCSGVGGVFDDGVYKTEYLLPDCSFGLVQLRDKNAINFNECYDYKIIGNIFENPELIK